MALTLIDSYAYSNNSDYQSIHSDNDLKGGQSFSCDDEGYFLREIRMELKRSGSPTGSVYCKLYAHSGTYGSTGVPTGSALATAVTVLDPADLTISDAEYIFEFDGTYELEDGTDYFWMLEYSGGSSANRVRIACDDDAPTHGGNYAGYITSWTYETGADCGFEVYGSKYCGGHYGWTHAEASMLGLGGNYAYNARGQCFDPDSDFKLTQLHFKGESYTETGGTVVAKIYSVTGTPGTDAEPNTLLATSDTVSYADLPATEDWIDFDFSGTNQIILENGTYYFAVIDADNITGGYMKSRADYSVSSPPGNYAAQLDADKSWGAYTTRAYPFYAMGYEFTTLEKSDTIRPKISESSTLVKTMDNYGDDELKPKITESSDISILVEVTSADTLRPKITGDGTQEIAGFVTSDDLIIALEDSNDLINMNSRMNAPIRQIVGKVEITFSSPFTDESIDVSSNETINENTDLDNLANSLTEPAYKWFNLHNNSLDGTYHPMSAAELSRCGAWGTTLSDASGEFTTDPVFTLEFEARPITNLKLYGDSELEEYPVDFTIRLYSEGDVLEHTEPVTGNSDVEWSADVDEVDIVKMTITISEWSEAYSVVKLYEIFTSIVEEYQNDDIFFIDMLEELEYESGTLAIGNVSSNEIAVGLYNEDDIFNPNNPSSPLKDYIKKNRRLQAWLGVEMETDVFEWQSLGVFWTTDWRVEDDEVIAEVKGLDRLELLRKTDFSTSEVYEDYSLKDLADEVFTDAGIDSAYYEVATALDSITVPYAWFDKMTHRAALKRIAAAGLAVVYCDRDGVIKMEPIDTSGSPVFEFNEDNYFSKTQSTRTEIFNSIEVKAIPRIEGTQEVIYEDYEEFAVAAGASVTKTHFFNFTPCIDVQQPTIVQSGSDITVDSYTAYAWGIEVTYANSGGTSQNVEEIEIQGKKLDVAGGQIAVAEDTASIGENGKQSLSTPITSELIQTLAQAQDIADDLLPIYKDPYRNVKLKARGHIGLKIGEVVTAPEFEDALEDFVIVRQLINFDGTLSASIDIQKVGG